MFFMVDWRSTLLAILPLPVMVVVTSRHWTQNHKAFKEAQERLLRAEQLCPGIRIRVKVTKSFGFQADEIQAF